MPPSRRLAAIMFTDLADFTRAAHADEQAALRGLEEIERAVGPVIAAHHGRTVKKIGDGRLVEFSSARDAVACGVEMQEALRRLPRREGRGPLGMRVGIHLGDVEDREGDILGDSVNIASRIEALAESGGVSISAPVHEQVRHKLPYTFVSLGPRPLKGVSEPIEVFRVEARTSAAELPGGRTPPSNRRVAVLPFQNLSPEPQDGYFADGLTEEMIGELSQVPGLQVIARTSVLRYKSSPCGIQQIGRELDVGYAVEGSVRKSGSKLRISAQLVDARSEASLWSGRFDRELTDIFAVQSEIARSVVHTLAEGVLTPGPRRDTEDVEAYTYYLRAVQLLHDDTVESVRAARRLLEEALARDPRFARAWAALAKAWVEMVFHGLEEWVVVEQHGEPAARRAVELAPDSAEAHAAMSEVHSCLDRLRLSVAEAERALEINPNLAEALDILGRQFGLLGELERASVHLRRAFELDPVSLRIGLNLAWVLQLAGHGAEAKAVLDRLAHLDARDARVVDGFAEYYRLNGDLARSEKVLREGLLAEPDEPTLLADLAGLFALAGRTTEARATLAAAEAATPQGTGKALARLFVLSALGDLDGAFEALAYLTETHSWPFLLTSLPYFAALRHDPRFAGFLQKAGLAA